MKRALLACVLVLAGCSRPLFATHFEPLEPAPDAAESAPASAGDAGAGR